MDVNVSPNEETVWLSLNEICLLFDRDKSVISRHIRNIFASNELIENSCVAFFATELNKDIEMLNKQYGKSTIKYTDKVHDRYIIIYQIKLYHLGASIKDLGKKIFSLSKSPKEIIDELLLRI